MSLYRLGLSTPVHRTAFQKQVGAVRPEGATSAASLSAAESMRATFPTRFLVIWSGLDGAWYVQTENESAAYDTYDAAVTDGDTAYAAVYDATIARDTPRDEYRKGLNDPDVSFEPGKDKDLGTITIRQKGSPLPTGVKVAAGVGLAALVVSVVASKKG